MRYEKMYDKYREIEDIRRHFRRPGRHPAGEIRVNKNVFETNNAQDAKQWHTLHRRVRSILSQGRFRRHVTRDDDVSERAHHCDVLGPYCCTHCTKLAQQRKLKDIVSRTFPRVEYVQRPFDRGDSIFCDGTNAQNTNSCVTPAKAILPRIDTTRSTLHRPWRQATLEASSHAQHRPRNHVISPLELHLRVMSKQRRRHVFSRHVINHVEYPPLPNIQTVEASASSLKRARFVTEATNDARCKKYE